MCRASVFSMPARRVENVSGAGPFAACDLGILDFEVGDVFAARFGISIPANNGKPSPGAYNRAPLTSEQADILTMNAVACFEGGRIEKLIEK
jgi:hypothetical protein